MDAHANVPTLRSLCLSILTPGPLNQSKQRWMKFFRQSIIIMYRYWKTRSIFIPPLIFNQTQHSVHTIGGATVYVPEEPKATASKGDRSLQVSDVRDDNAQHRVLLALRDLAQKEVFCVLSQLQFGDYMTSSCYAAATQFFSLARDLQHQQLDRGDFDVLIIHPELGLIAGEIKAVGDSFDASMTQAEKDRAIIKRIKRALKQLEKSTKVLQHLVCDLRVLPPIIPTLILPNVTDAHLRSLLASDSTLNQVFALLYVQIVFVLNEIKRSSSILTY